ncbi:hypothetical protein, partial [Streptomyces albus]|uniref:hypothetical protein n=1 Tax=Streptomyces albus TaxID=1888 RepID=UPI001969D67A
MGHKSHARRRLAERRSLMRRPSARRFPRRLPRGGPGASCPAGTAPAPPPVGRSVVVFLTLALTASCVHVD